MQHPINEYLNGLNLQNALYGGNRPFDPIWLETLHAVWPERYGETENPYPGGLLSGFVPSATQRAVAFENFNRLEALTTLVEGVEDV